MDLPNPNFEPFEFVWGSTDIGLDVVGDIISSRQPFGSGFDVGLHAVNLTAGSDADRGVAAVPEPSTCLTAVMALLGILAGYRRCG